MAKTVATIEHTDRSRIKRLWSKYMRPFRGSFGLAMIFMLIQALTVSAYGMLMKYVIDYAQAMPSLSDGADPALAAKAFAIAIVPFVIGLTLISGVSLYLASVLTNKVSLSTIGELQKDMFASAHRADYASMTREPVGNLISKFTNDVNVLSAGLLRSMNNLFRDSLTLIGILATMIYLDWLLTLIVLVIYPIAAMPIIRISKALRGNSNDAQAHIGQITSELNESFSGARMVKTYGLEESENTRLNKSFSERVRLYLKLVSNQARVDPILEVLGGLAIAGVFVIGVYRVVGGHSTAGDIVGILTLLLAASPKVRALGTLNNVIQESLAALKRIFGVIDDVPTIIDTPNAKPLTVQGGSVKFDDVRFDYENGTEALGGLTLEARPGQTIALVGPSGGGKSTIINLIPRLYDVSEGHVSIDGQDVREVTLESLRQSLALVSQDVTLFDDTVAANIAFGKLGAGQDEIERAAKSAAAHDFILALPQGYETRVGEGGKSLSGGQRQRIALARAILRDAPILLLDEATSALDAQSESQVQAALDRLSEGRTTIVIAHRLSTVRKADKIYVLDQGRIVESGKHAALMKKDGLYAKLRRLQFSE